MIIFEHESLLPQVYDLQQSYLDVTETIAVALHYYEKTGNVEYISEGFSDGIAKAIDAVKKFVEKVKAFFRRLFMRINSNFMEYDKLVQVCRNDILPNWKTDFSIDGFIYTHLGEMPDNGPIASVLNMENDILSLFSKLSSEELKQKVDKIASELVYSQLRADTLNVKDKISKEDLRSYCYTFYRNGQDYSSKIVCNRETVNEIVSNADTIKRVKQKTLDSKKKVDNMLHSMERIFTDRLSDISKGVNNSIDVETFDTNGKSYERTIGESDFDKLMFLTTAMHKVTIELSYMMTTIYGEKVSSLEDYIRQSSEIMRTAIRKNTGAISESIMIFDKYNSYPQCPNQNWAGVFEGINL